MMNQVEDAASVLEQFQQDGECSLLLFPRTLNTELAIQSQIYPAKYTISTKKFRLRTGSSRIVEIPLQVVIVVSRNGLG